MDAIHGPITAVLIRSLLTSIVATQTGGASPEVTTPSLHTIWDIKPPFTFTITTTTPDDKPQPGVMIECIHPRPERGRALVDLTARTDDSGTALFTVTDVNLATDRHIWFSVADGRFASNGGVGISPIDREFTWTFKTLPLQSRTVKLVDPQGKGIAGGRVWIGCAHVFPDNQDNRSDDEGTISLRCPAGPLTMAAIAPGYASCVLREVQLTGDGRKVRFTKRPVEQEVIVAAGRYEFHQLPEPFRKNTVAMYADEADHNMGGGGGTARSVDELLQALGDRVGIPVVNETQPVEATRISHTHYRSSCLTRITDAVEKARKLGTLLQNVSAQTSLQFSIERRTMEKWFLTEEGP